MRYACALLLAVMMGCSGKSSGGGDAGPSRDAFVLPDASMGDAADVETAPPKECEKDEDCVAKKGEGYACNCLFKCIEVPQKNGCREDKNCGSGKRCEPCTKTCAPLLPPCAECKEDAECDGQLSRCVSEVKVDGVLMTLAKRFCAPWCPLSTHICAVEGAPQGAYKCAEIPGDTKNGVCVPVDLDCGQVGKQCVEDKDCVDPKKPKCWPDLHVCGCRSTLDCDFGQTCHKVTHACVPGCTADTECGKGKVCSEAQCQDACVSNPDGSITGCPDEVPEGAPPGSKWACDDKGHCYIPGMCFSPTDCMEPETYCDGDTHTCVKGCLIDYDCKSAAKICDVGTKTCVDRGCTANYMCSCGQVCDKASAQCKAAVGKYCEPCDQNNGENACGDKEIMCIGFKDKDGNDKGSYCMPPCDQDPDNPCPQGWQCQEIKDDKGTSYGKKCIRFCYQEVKGGCAIGQPQAKDATPPTPDP